MTLTIEFDDLRFSANHGLYAEETVAGGDYMMDMKVWYETETIPVKDFKKTVDYVNVYEIVHGFMQNPTPLLETIVTQIAVTILQQYRQVTMVYVRLYKMHPPITQFRGKVGVSFTCKREDL